MQRFGLPFLMILVSAMSLFAGELKLQGPVEVDVDWNDEKKPVDVSGCAQHGPFLVVCDNESKHSVHVLEEDANGRYRFRRNVRLLEEEDEHKAELDLEAVANHGDTFYVVGSHSRSPGGDRQKAREHLFRFQLDDNGKLRGQVESASLRDVIKKFDVLEAASKLTTKDGGVDIEGIACDANWVYVGFRGPVVAGQAFVVKFKFDDPEATAELFTLNLGGGIRDMRQVGGQFVLLVGPSNEDDGKFFLVHWNGLPGKDSRQQQLCQVPSEKDLRPEGLQFLSVSVAGVIEFILWHDGPKGGKPRRYRLDPT